MTDRPSGSGSDGAVDRLARGALRASLRTSRRGAVLVVALGVAGSWFATHAFGGADSVVPHWYYLPILFAAARFGHLAALIVALVSGLLAGPLTYVDVPGVVQQETARWVTRSAFFVGIGQLMAALVRPSLPSVTDEMRRLRDQRAQRKALREREFFLLYQPIVDVRTAEIVAVEALVRWRHPVRGLLGPAEFLPAAERSDAIRDLGAFVLEEACRQAVSLNAVTDRQRAARLSVNVNVSGRELEAPDFVDGVRACLERSGLPPHQLCLEITESVLIDDLETCLAQLAGLEGLGVRLAVDDFGTGYSSLAAVHRFPVDVLKVDRCFFETLGSDGQADAMSGGVVMLARTLALTTVAEGIETREQAEAVVDSGYDLAQGFYFARPLAVDALTQLLETTGGRVTPPAARAREPVGRGREPVARRVPDRASDGER